MIVLATAFAAIGFAGCNELGSPEGVLGSAYKDIQKGKLSAFRATLSGDALATYGNAAGLAQLKQELAGLNVSLGSSKLIWSSTEDFSEKTYIYELDVLAKTKDAATYSRFKTATVVCVWERGHQPAPGYQRYYDRLDLTTCQISELE